jgi:hypothetical protein
MSEESALARLAVERGWITEEQARSGRPLSELLSPEQLAELQSGRALARRIIESNFLNVEAPRATPKKFIIAAVAAVLVLPALAYFGYSYQRFQHLQAAQAQIRRPDADAQTLEQALKTPDLPPESIHQGCAALARIHRNAGLWTQARSELDRAVEAGQGLKIGETYFERARLEWERMLLGSGSRDAVVRDLRAALQSGFTDAWLYDYCRVFLDLAEKPTPENFKSWKPKLEGLQEIRCPEEISKFMGDCYLVAGRADAAAKEYQNAVAKRPGYIEARIGLALAEKSVEPLKHLDPRHEGVKEALGKIK